ncbi:MSMEG_1061 family FMN-dependent PPOX-type flavoprotein [Streptomyces iconiensis]|uniref:Pyridoxamine 5'-phosphate oxidase family protein n=1 Tax=Streptomyces iconiensis TaxID=1384038 RepID=A0ABT7A3M8_9ACTN|nr:MSMEG_1061 family FMN-dependent PPOX-type flavoprotein [Streptomyces iconiensis]MDJ1135669.1 pyridoxamine 5'-phosphate oxidase family protein [Streptomyces iconiensis]
MTITDTPPVSTGATTPQTAADAYRSIDMERVRQIVGHPPQFIADKKADFVGEFAMRFIAHSTFFCMATSDETGQIDNSPKGDPPGSVRVLDPWTLAVPDRPGNKLADSFENIMRNPAVGLVFFVPGIREAVRVNGDAFVTDDSELLQMLGAEGKPAVLATVVRVREVYSQCGKAVIRSKLWDGDQRGLAEAVMLGGDFGSLAVSEQASKMTAALGDQLSGLGDLLEHDYRHGLY